VLYFELAAVGTPFYDEEYAVTVRYDTKYIARDQFLTEGRWNRLFHRRYTFE